MKSKNLSEKILRLIKSKGFNNIELEPVLETKYILQRSGENFRKYLFSYHNSDGKELCLRPDLTISSILKYAKSNKNSKEKVFYTGNAFRKSYSKKNVVINQIGIETHLIKRINMREQLVKLVEIIPIEFVVRNIATGSLTKRLRIEDGTVLDKPLIEFYY